MVFFAEAQEKDIVFPEQIREHLFKDGFRFRAWQSWQKITPQIDSRPGLTKIVAEAEARLQAAIADKWSPEWKKIHMQPIKGRNGEADLLIMRYSANGWAVEIAAGEFFTTVTFTQPRKPKTLPNDQAAKQAYISWLKEVFALTLEEMPIPEIHKRTDYWLFFPGPQKNADGSERNLHSTWPSMLQFAFALNGEWFSVIIHDRLPRSTKGGPIAGGRERVSGSWFDNELTSSKSNSKK